MLIEVCKKQLADGFPKSDFPITDNEMLVLIDASIPVILKGQLFEGAKVTGVMDIPEAYLVTYAMSTLTQSTITNEWYADLPQMPLALPNGYSITDAYLSKNGQGRSQSILFIKTKRLSYRNNLPKPSGIFGRLEGRTVYLTATFGQMLFNETLYVQMPISRTASLDEVMHIPDDSIQPIIDNVVGKLRIRYQQPQDVVKDNLPAGNKTS